MPSRYFASQIFCALVAASCLFAPQALAVQTAALAWNASPDPATVGYAFYFGVKQSLGQTGTPTRLDVGQNTSATVSGLVEGQTYFFYVTAYNSSGLESEPSNQVNHQMTSLNVAPVVDAKSVQTSQGVPVAVVLTGSDANGDNLTFSVVSNPLNGLVAGTPPNMTYMPRSGFFGTDSFTYRANDGNLNSAPATVSITVARVNQAPVASNISAQTQQNKPVAIVLRGSDADGDVLRYSVVRSPSQGSLSGTAPNLTYTPAQNFYGTDSFQFNVSDGVLSSSPATVSITVLKANSPPVASNLSVQVNKGTSVSVKLVGTDPDGDPLRYEVVSNPVNGTLSGTAPNLTYTPAPTYVGADSFKFRVSDGISTSAPATVSISVLVPRSAGMRVRRTGNN